MVELLSEELLSGYLCERMQVQLLDRNQNWGINYGVRISRIESWQGSLAVCRQAWWHLRSLFKIRRERIRNEGREIEGEAKEKATFCMSKALANRNGNFWMSRETETNRPAIDISFCQFRLGSVSTSGRVQTSLKKSIIIYQKCPAWPAGDIFGKRPVTVRRNFEESIHFDQKQNHEIEILVDLWWNHPVFEGKRRFSQSQYPPWTARSNGFEKIGKHQIWSRNDDTGVRVLCDIAFMLFKIGARLRIAVCAITPAYNLQIWKFRRNEVPQ